MIWSLKNPSFRNVQWLWGVFFFIEMSTRTTEVDLVVVYKRPSFDFVNKKSIAPH